ncbi:MAG: extracellular solute-binding protein [Methyloligellaceae bacterium]
MNLLALLQAVFAAMFLLVAAPSGLAQTDTPHGQSDGAANAGQKNPASEDAAPAVAKKPERLMVASWGGAYSESQKRAYFTPFQTETGIAIEVISHQGALGVLTAEDETRRPKWDLVDLDLAALERACREGALEKVDASALAAAGDGTSASEDFFPGTLHECGIPSVAWSSAIVFDKRAFKKNAPKNAGDFFDIKRFPGKRVLPWGPKYTLELALMADGMAPEEVYAALASDEGINRAFNMLGAIKDHIIWWDRAYEPLELLASREAAMALGFNGRIFSAIVAENKPFSVIWDAQVFDLDLWAIPKGSAHKDSALEFIAFATKPDRLAHQAQMFPYGPVRKSALKLIGKHPQVDVEMAQYIPTSKNNFKRALRLDVLWWQEHEAKLKARFGDWFIGEDAPEVSGADAESENSPE